MPRRHPRLRTAADAPKAAMRVTTPLPPWMEEYVPRVTVSQGTCNG